MLNRDTGIDISAHPNQFHRSYTVDVASLAFEFLSRLPQGSRSHKQRFLFYCYILYCKVTVKPFAVNLQTPLHYKITKTISR